MSKKKGSPFPTYLKWTIALAAIVVITIVISLVTTRIVQRNALTTLGMEYGSTLAEFIALENAEVVLLEDWVGVQVIVDGIKDKNILDHLSITDYNQVVRGSTEPELIGQTYQQPATADPLLQQGNTRIYEMETPTGEPALYFSTPIQFKDIEVGRVQLGMVQTPLHKTLNLTTLTLLVQGLIILSAVIVIGYLSTTRLSQALQTLKRSLSEIAKGHHEFRIDATREDEFAELFSLANQAAETLRKLEDEKFTLLARPPTTSESTQILDSTLASPAKETEAVPDNGAASRIEARETHHDYRAQSPTAGPTVASAPAGNEPPQEATQIMAVGDTHSLLDTSQEQPEEEAEATRVVDVSKISLSSQRKKQDPEKNK